MNPNVLVTLTPVSPAGNAGITFSLDGDSTYKQASSGSGGWQIVDRPRQVAALQWYDRSPRSLEAKLIISSKTIYGTEDASIEPQCAQFETWLDKVPGTQLPPILAITGPVPGIQYVWVVFDFTFGTAIRDRQAGFRVQQNLDVTLYEYNAPLQGFGVLGNPSPVIAWIQTAIGDGSESSYLLYTVKSGDTLATIAANFYGDQAKWIEIGSLNNIRDPDNIFPGQQIKLPQS